MSLKARMSARPDLAPLAGYGSERDRERSREAGIDQHLLKPIEISQLVQAFA
jgi:CheY-like chemotaxis protein